MRKCTILLACLLLPACAAMQQGLTSAGTALCSNRDGLRLSYTLTMQNAAFIADPVVRQSVIGGAQAGLAALDACPALAAAP